MYFIYIYDNQAYLISKNIHHNLYRIGTVNNITFIYTLGLMQIQKIAAALGGEAIPPRMLRGHEEKKNVYLPVSSATFARASRSKNSPKDVGLSVFKPETRVRGSVPIGIPQSLVINAVNAYSMMSRQVIVTR